MIVVSDTAPLNYLLLIGEAELLPKLFGRVIVPPAVLDEMIHPAAPEIVRAWAANPPAWIESMRPAAPIFAKELKADLLLIDERRAKQVAIANHVKVTGTLGVLEFAAQRGLINLATAIDALCQTTFRRPDYLIDEILKRNRPD
ncbi:MAG: DUF3368 domain-containing protein [Candidatus Sulfotelmatobacter sp.]